MAVKGSVPTPGVIVPHLVVKDARAALAFYTKAFSAKVLYCSPSPSGFGEHLHVKIWNSLIQISSEEPAQRREKVEGVLLASPETLFGSTCVFQIGVADVDSAFQQAVDHGAVPAIPPTDMFWGDRYSWIRDPFGHVWALSKVNEVLTQEEVERRLHRFAALSKGQDK
jgi:PhnB protein